MTTRTRLLSAISLTLLATPAWSMEKMTDEQLSNVQAQGANWTFENIEFLGETGPNGEPAGSISSIGTDGSSLTLDKFRFSALAIGTREAPITTGSVVANGSVNGYDLANVSVVEDKANLGDRNYLRIGLSDLSAWQNVDIAFDALYGNPTELDAANPNIMAGGTPSAYPEFGRVTFDNLALAGHIDIAEIPLGYRVKSYQMDESLLDLDGSREGMLLNVAIDELAVDRILLEGGQADGVFDGSRDLLVSNFSLKNLNMKSATIETTKTGLRFAYSDPQPFTTSAGEVVSPGEAGHPNTLSPAYDPNFPKLSLTFDSQMTGSLPSTSRMTGVTLDHLVFNLRTD